MVPPLSCCRKARQVSEDNGRQAELETCNGVKHVATQCQHPVHLSDQGLATGRLVRPSRVLCLCHTHNLVARTMLARHKVHQIGRPAGRDTRSEAASLLEGDNGQGPLRISNRCLQLSRPGGPFCCKSWEFLC